MDLIASLSSQLGIDSTRAQGLAGAVLGQLEQGVEQKLGAADAEALRSQVPEIGDWKSKIGALEGGGAGLAGGLLGAAGGLLGGSGLLGGASGGLDVASLIQLAAKAGVGSGAAQKLLPIVVSFLESRLDPALLQRVLSAVVAGKRPGGGLLGALGGILGG